MNRRQRQCKSGWRKANQAGTEELRSDKVRDGMVKRMTQANAHALLTDNDQRVTVTPQQSHLATRAVRPCNTQQQALFPFVSFLGTPTLLLPILRREHMDALHALLRCCSERSPASLASSKLSGPFSSTKASVLRFVFVCASGQAVGGEPELL